jgi:hypothetical protein
LAHGRCGKLAIRIADVVRQRECRRPWWRTWRGVVVVSLKVICTRGRVLALCGYSDVVRLSERGILELVVVVFAIRLVECII